MRKRSLCQDFDRLANDIEKYYRGSTLFSEKQKEEWIKFFNVESHYYNFEEDQIWLLDSLKSKK